MITQLVWTTWTRMSAVSKKAVKLNHSLNVLRFSHYLHLISSVCVSKISILSSLPAAISQYNLSASHFHSTSKVNLCLDTNPIFILACVVHDLSAYYGVTTIILKNIRVFNEF